ncbi:probable transcription factor At4g00390 [Panicum hallii]|uniref:probable transcription factor At4g00390 n=1 Tax=Panicum hallii TaxID=206008 RepID=UPI000DF4DEBD|nr:probable transcription factor At4g00390 [Panicum hallii]
MAGGGFWALGGHGGPGGFGGLGHGLRWLPGLRKAGTAASPSHTPRNPRPRSRSPDAASVSGSAASDADSASDDNTSPLPPPRQSRGEDAAINPLSSRPMDPPRRSMVPSFMEPRPKRPRSVAVPSSVEQLKRPSRLWSLADELVILRVLAAYHARRGVRPGSMHDIAKLQGLIQSELSVQVTPTQLSDKVRRLKQKYKLLASRAKNGRDPDFPTPHDRSVYELGSISNI